MNKPGFTLVEILVAFALVVITLTSFNYVAQQVKQIAKRSEQAAQTTYSLQAKMEELKLLPYDALLLRSSVTPLADGLAEVKLRLNKQELVTWQSKH